MRKIACTLLAALFVCGLLAGCGKKEKEDTSLSATAGGQAEMKANMMKGGDLMAKGKTK